MDLEMNGNREHRGSTCGLSAAPQAGEGRLGPIHWSPTLMDGVQPSGTCLGSSLPPLRLATVDRRDRDRRDVVSSREFGVFLMSVSCGDESLAAFLAKENSKRRFLSSMKLSKEPSRSRVRTALPTSPRHVSPQMTAMEKSAALAVPHGRRRIDKEELQGLGPAFLAS
jgi:hypothetical protein